MKAQILFRRRLSALLLSAVIGVLAGCGGYPSEMAREPSKGWEPVAATCHDTFVTYLSRTSYEPVACTEPHSYETVHVGRFGADTDVLPTSASTVYHQAWAECDKAFTEFLGGPWRDRNLRLRVAVPDPLGWDDGARWYACETTILVVLGQESLSVSVKNGFTSLPELAYGCADVEESGQIFSAKRCDQPHNAEYVGSILHDVGYDQMREEVDSSPCIALVDRFTGTEAEYGWWERDPGRDDWELGDRYLRCFLWTGEGEPVSRSLKA
jgi:hypothetical protein